MHKVTGFEVESRALHGAEDGFLRVCRVRLRNRRDDGSLSDRYICDYVTRPKGADAVVVGLWRRGHTTPEVLLRRGLRPALVLGRPDADVPIADGRTDARLLEVVAGIIEREDRGEAGVKKRACIEAYEEAGIEIEPSQVEFLGAATFPSAGSMPEKFWLVAAEVPNDVQMHSPPTDGSPMEEGAELQWVSLIDAIAWCEAGTIEDCKTELVLRRLESRLRPTA